MGLLITVMVCAASVQDRDGAKSALLGSYLSARRCRFVFADAGFGRSDVRRGGGDLPVVRTGWRQPAIVQGGRGVRGGLVNRGVDRLE
jgi:hypothetical protein